ncbi:MAG: OsmC family protein [Promicromonosporaceae bacterium]|nr:OsmC family protein [Promicromonosporaceae bacterium]
MSVDHQYNVSVAWADANGTGSYASYSRDHQISGVDKTHALEMSAPEWFRGTKTLYNPGELFLASIAAAHMIRFLEVASQVGLVVLEYTDDARGSAHLGSRGDGVMGPPTLRPRITVQDGPHANDDDIARLHERAQSMSVVRRSLSIDVFVEPAGLIVLG